jgi:hypothetical protein
MRAVQEWMGHGDQRTTLIYADYAPDLSQGAIWAARAFGAVVETGCGPRDNHPVGPDSIPDGRGLRTPRRGLREPRREPPHDD